MYSTKVPLTPQRKALSNKVGVPETHSDVGQWNEGWGRSSEEKAVDAEGVKSQGRNCAPNQAYSASAHTGCRHLHLQVLSHHLLISSRHFFFKRAAIGSFARFFVA